MDASYYGRINERGVRYPATAAPEAYRRTRYPFNAAEICVQRMPVLSGIMRSECIQLRRSTMPKSIYCLIKVPNHRNPNPLTTKRLHHLQICRIAVLRFVNEHFRKPVCERIKYRLASFI